MREITVGDVPVRALRVTYVGELGWELYCPSEYGVGLWRALWEAGEPHGLVAGGYRAIDSLRLEKGYRVWGADITPDETPYEGGRRLLREARQGGRIHRPRCAASSRRRAGPRTRLRCLVLEDPRSVALGNEPVRIDGEIARPRDHRRIRLQGRAVDRLRLLPPEHAEPGTRGGGRDLRHAGSRARSRPSRCSIRRASGSGPELQARDARTAPVGGRPLAPASRRSAARRRRGGWPGR